MASQPQRASAAPWVLTGLMMLGSGALIFVGFDAFKDLQAKVDAAKVERDQALSEVKQLKSRVDELTAAHETDRTKMVGLAAALEATSAELENAKAPKK